MNLIQSIKSAYKNYWNFRGRASRSEFWYFYLFEILGWIILSAVEVTLTAIFAYQQSLVSTPILFAIWVLRILFYIFNLIPNLFLTIRRLHDTNHSGWFVLINLIPLVGFIIYIVCLCDKSDEGDNDYGPHPLSQSQEPASATSS